MLQNASIVLLFGFIALPVLVAVALMALVWTAVGAAGLSRTRTTTLQIRLALGAVAWIAITLWVAASGILRHFEWRPPPMLVLMAAVAGIAAWLAFSWVGDAVVRHASWAALIGLQTFRLPLELLMHRASSEGLMPAQMSYSGRNFDILTGITAAALGYACLKTQVPRWLIVLWNVVGTILLMNILGIAVAAMPMFQAFGPDRLNVWVAEPPFVWLPAVMVLTALAGHLLVFRKLRVL